MKFDLFEMTAFGEALVVAEVEVRLRPVLGHEDLPVLEGVHRPRVHVDIGIELLERDREAPRFEKGADGGGSKALAERGDDTARDEDELLSHGSNPFMKNVTICSPENSLPPLPSS